MELKITNLLHVHLMFHGCFKVHYPVDFSPNQSRIKVWWNQRLSSSKLTWICKLHHRSRCFSQGLPIVFQWFSQGLRHGIPRARSNHRGPRRRLVSGSLRKCFSQQLFEPGLQSQQFARSNGKPWLLHLMNPYGKPRCERIKKRSWWVCNSSFAWVYGMYLCDIVLELWKISWCIELVSRGTTNTLPPP